MNFPLITDPSFYAVAIPAVLLLGISKSGFGTGFGSLAVPLMALSVTVPQAAAILMPVLLFMDVLALAKAGIDWAVAPLGTALTSFQAQAIRRYVDQMHILMDGDRAGREASLRAGQLLEKAGAGLLELCRSRLRWPGVLLPRTDLVGTIWSLPCLSRLEATSRPLLLYLLPLLFQ